MALEIEKMNALKEKVTGAEKEEIEGIIENLSTNFKEMLQDTRVYLTTGEKVSRDFSDSIATLKKLKSFGDQHGVEFPEINTNKDAAVYILKFGSEIVKAK